MAWTAGDVVLVPFPYRDQLAESAGPAVVISTPSFQLQGDIIVAAITSHGPRSPTDDELVDWQAAGLRLPSTVRMLIATMADSRVLYHIGHLSDRNWAEVLIRLRLAIV